MDQRRWVAHPSLDTTTVMAAIAALSLSMIQLAGSGQAWQIDITVQLNGMRIQAIVGSENRQRPICNDAFLDRRLDF